MPPDPYYIFRYVSSIALDSNDINLMYHIAFTDCTWSIVSAGVIPKVCLKTYVTVPKNDRNLIAEFRDETDGTLFSKWLSRPDAVKVSSMLYFLYMCCCVFNNSPCYNFVAHLFIFPQLLSFPVLHST
jgi:hypothetical protein